VLCADLPPTSRHMKHDRAKKMNVYRRKYCNKIRGLVHKLGTIVCSAPGSASTTSTKNALESAISILFGGAGGGGGNTAGSESTVESTAIYPPVVEATQIQAYLVARRTVVLPPILRAPPSEIIVPAGMLPVAMSSYDHPSLTPLVRLEILRMHAADAMIDLAKAAN